MHSETLGTNRMYLAETAFIEQFQTCFKGTAHIRLYKELVHALTCVHRVMDARGNFGEHGEA